jgi:hypothetical protein
VAADDVVFQVFQAFQTNVSSVSSGCCRVDLGCFICCNDNICMFQAYVQSVSVVSDACFLCFHLDVAYVCYGCTHMFQVFVFMCFRCCICLLWLHTYVSSVCFHVF